MSPDVDHWKIAKIHDASDVVSSIRRSAEEINTFPPEYPLIPIVNASEEGEYESFDKDTPDGWIRRDSRLVKLTGKHPHNAEAPLSLLFDTGFLTPPELFFVRNHGTVPKIDNSALDTWKVTVDGMVKNPMQFTIDDLKNKFEVVSLPITLVCAGNRRREQNVVEKGLGFNWGAAGVSTALWTGVYLADILAYVEPVRSRESLLRPRHVIFEGVDQLPQGPYGTSQPLSCCSDRSKGILVCWAMNGKTLTPDHGFPLRMVIPGKIGGRSVKWLHRIEVSHQESQHYLHYYDNKVLPTQVTTSQARAEDHWWHDQRYIIQDLNVNSAIARPAHDETVLLNNNEDYTIQGYAYSGGGRRVTRVEVSVDEGVTWLLSEIDYPEDTYRLRAYASSGVFGKVDLTEREECFCWCFWRFRIKLAELRERSSIQVRAMDEGLALQPRDMYWNVLSMMNNWWFRVAIHITSDGRSLRFEHPTMPGTQPGGWMQRMKDESLDIRKPAFSSRASTATRIDSEKQTSFEREIVVMTSDDVKREIGLEEMRSSGKSWFVVEGQVYDGTEYLNEHPGGGYAISGMAGQDATEDFIAIHSMDARKQLAQYHIGTLVPSERDAMKASVTQNGNLSELSKTRWMQVRLLSVEKVSHDSRLYRFALPDRNQSLNLPVGQHIYLRLRTKTTADSGANQGDLVQRAFTPVSSSDTLGYVDLLIKLYLPNESFPAGGKMSCCLNEIEVGDYVEIKGPFGEFTWLGQNSVLYKGIQRGVHKVGMVCGGSGITPILQTLRGILSDDLSDAKVWLVDANKTEDDILCREELDVLQRSFRERFNLHHTLNKVPEGWRGCQGHVSKVMLQHSLPPPDIDAIVLICGPEGMIKTCKSALMELGWNESQVVLF